MADTNKSYVVANAFKLTAIVNGKTISSHVVLDNDVPLFQFFDPDAGTHSPSWANSEKHGPKFHAEAEDSTGTSYTVLDPTLYWNGTPVTFDDDGNSAAGFPGTEAGTVVRSVVDGVTYYQIMKEVFDSTNEDQDQFYIKGTVRLAGNNPQPAVTEVETLTVVGTSAGGSAVYGIIDGADIEDGADSAAQTAHLYKPNGKSVTEITAASYKWYNISGTDATECDTDNGYTLSADGRTLTVPQGKVNGNEVFRCDMTYNGSTISAYVGVRDKNDGYYIRLSESGTFAGTAGEHIYGSIQEDETVTVQADIVNTEGTVVPSNLKIMYHVTKGDGSVWNAKSGQGGGDKKNQMSFTYDEIVGAITDDDSTTGAGGGCNGYVSAELAS